MEFFEFNREQLKYVRATHKVVMNIVLSAVVVFLFGTLIGMNSCNQLPMQREVSIQIQRQLDSMAVFTPEKLKAEIIRLNIKYPDVVFAQAIQETGRFTSQIFKLNNNLFGMKRCGARPTTQTGEENGHATYSDWRSSVQDYALWQAYLLKNIASRAEYIALLGEIYATPTYIKEISAHFDEWNKIQIP